MGHQYETPKNEEISNVTNICPPDQFFDTIIFSIVLVLILFLWRNMVEELVLEILVGSVN
jgi:hypothetical protein